MSDDAYWLKLWAIIACTVVAVCLIVSATVMSIKVKAMENGYEEVVLPGAVGTVWQKVRAP